jgi:hypothetical protein
LIAPSQGPSFSSDNLLPAFLAFLAEDTKVGERTARQYVAHLQRFAVWLEPPLECAAHCGQRQSAVKVA